MIALAGHGDSKPLKPFQGLKHVEQEKVISLLADSKPLKPFQGLKHVLDDRKGDNSLKIQSL